MPRLFCEGSNMPQTKQDGFVQPVQPAAGTVDGESFVLKRSDVFASDHPIVRAHPELFRPLEATHQRPCVEQATAAPGEKRGQSKPDKS